MTAAGLRVVCLYSGTVAPDHGGRRILEQMAWLAAEGFHISLAPVADEGGPAPEISPVVSARGIDVLDPLIVRGMSRAGRSWGGLRAHPTDLRHVRTSLDNADWIIEGNILLVGLSELMRGPERRRPVLTWDGDAASRWHATHVRWLLRRDPMRAARRSVFVASTQRDERYLLRHRDLVTVPGPADRAALAHGRRYRTPIVVVPNVVRVREDRPAEPVLPDLDVLFVGSAYGPNVDGLRWFLVHVWPSVRACRPGARLVVAGRDMHANVIGHTAASAAGVEFVGRVPDIDALYHSAKVAIVPLFYGSGVPNKFLEALGANIGIVATNYVRTAVGAPGGLRSTDGIQAWRDALVNALDDPRSARVAPAVRTALLASHGSRGFDSAMQSVVSHVRGLLTR